jgi:hypothetical protein
LKLWSPSKYSPCDWLQQSQHRSHRKCCQGPPAIRGRPLTAFQLGTVLGLLPPVAGGVLRRGPMFQTCTNNLNNFFNNTGNFLVHSRTCPKPWHIWWWDKGVGGRSQAPALLRPPFYVGYRWPGVAQYKVTVCVKIILVQVYCQLLPLQGGLRLMILCLTETGAMTVAEAMFCHSWFLGLVQMYASMLYFAPRLDSPSTVSYVHFSYSSRIRYAPGTLSSNPASADLSICVVFLFGMWSFSY